MAKENVLKRIEDFVEGVKLVPEVVEMNIDNLDNFIVFTSSWLEDQQTKDILYAYFNNTFSVSYNNVSLKFSCLNLSDSKGIVIQRDWVSGYLFLFDKEELPALRSLLDVPEDWWTE